MTKKGFIKLLMIVCGFMLFVLGMILSCNYTGLIHWIGIVALVIGIILLVGGIFAPIFIKNRNTMYKVLGVILGCCVCHAIGIVLMIYVHWLAGLPLVLLGIVGFLFLIPAIKGFKQE